MADHGRRLYGWREISLCIRLRRRGFAPTIRAFSELSEPMANTAQSRKRARQSEKRRQHNAALRTTFRSAVKKVQKAIAAGDKAGAAQLFRGATSALDRIADKRVIHKNKAARQKRRLAAEIKALA
jgi:small subunit ribosomal protein S20